MLLGMVIYEFAVGMCGIGWLHSQEWLCYWGGGDLRVCGWDAWNWVAAQPGVAVLLGTIALLK